MERKTDSKPPPVHLEGNERITDMCLAPSFSFALPPNLCFSFHVGSLVHSVCNLYESTVVTTVS